MKLHRTDKIDPALLGFDFDGVIADTAESFLRIACKEHGLCGFSREDITCFEVEQCLNIPAKAVQEIFRKILEDSVGVGLLPMPGSLEVLSELAEESEVTVITARPCVGPVLEWFEQVLPSPSLSSIRVVAMGDHDDKSRYLLEHGLRFFVDDRAETCRQIQAAGIQPVVFSQPWNSNCRQFPVVNSWQEIRMLLRFP